MPKTKKYQNLPYCYGYDSYGGRENLFERQYQPLVAREFLTKGKKLIEAYPNKGQHPLPCRFGPYLKHDFSGFFYDDGNSPRIDKSTRKKAKTLWADFFDGQDVRDYLYNIHVDYLFPDRLVKGRYEGKAGRSSPVYEKET